jgi:hypothetical protein
MLHIAKGRATPQIYRFPYQAVLAGTTWTSELLVWDEDGDPVALGGYEFAARISDAYDNVIATGSIVIPEPGVIRWFFEDNTFENTISGQYRFTLDIRLNSVTQRLIDSPLSVRGGVLRGEFVAPADVSEIRIVLGNQLLDAAFALASEIEVVSQDVVRTVDGAQGLFAPLSSGSITLSSAATLSVTGSQTLAKANQVGSISVPIPAARVVTGAQQTQRPTNTSSITVGSSGLPTASTVGYIAAQHGSLTNSTGPRTVTTAGTTITNVNFLSGHEIRIQASNVTIQRCVIGSHDFIDLWHTSGTNIVIQDCTFNGNSVGVTAIVSQDCTIQRCVFNGYENNFSSGGGNIVFINNYCDNVTDLGVNPDAHPDCIQIDGAVSNIRIQNNVMINNEFTTSALMIDNAYGAVSNIQVFGTT